MSYLLGYQKWRKLHESAGYRKIYEQSESSEIYDFILVAGTDANRTNDAITNDKNEIKEKIEPLPQAQQGVCNLYEISLLDAVLGKWSKAKVLGKTDYGNIKSRDQVRFDGKTISGPGEIEIIFDESSASKMITVSGNGTLAMFRASREIYEVGKASGGIANAVSKMKGIIKLYVGQPTESNAKFINNNTTEGGNPRFSRFVGITGDTFRDISPYVTQAALPALHYMIYPNDGKFVDYLLDKPGKGQEQLTEKQVPGPVEKKAADSLLAVMLQKYALKNKKYYSAGKLFSDSVGFNGIYGVSVSLGREEYTGLQAFKSKTVQFLTGGDGVLSEGPMNAVIQYAKVTNASLVKDGGPIDQYFNKLNEVAQGKIEESLMSRLITGIKTLARSAVEDNTKIEDFKKQVNGLVKIHYLKYQSKPGEVKGTPRPNILTTGTADPSGVTGVKPNAVPPNR